MNFKEALIKNLAKAVSIVGLFAFIFLFFPFVSANKHLLPQIGFWTSVAIGIATSILFLWVWLTRKGITLAETTKSEKMAKIQRAMYATSCIVFVIHCSVMFSICTAFGDIGDFDSYQKAVTFGLYLSASMQLASLAIEAIFHSDRCYK